MRRTTSQTDLRDVATVATGGSAVRALDFDRAYDELAAAREQYDRYAGRADEVQRLAAASMRLAEARATMAELRAG